MKDEGLREETIERLSNILDAYGTLVTYPLSTDMIRDIVGLLKEQEPKPVKVVKNVYNHEFYYCPRCDRSFYELFFVKPKFCDKCGQAVKWDG